MPMMMGFLLAHNLNRSFPVPPVLMLTPFCTLIGQIGLFTALFIVGDGFSLLIRERKVDVYLKKRTVNLFSAIRLAKSWYFLVFVSCQYVMRASIGQLSNDVFGGFVDENDVGFEL
jgi:hypothetical protein